MEFLVPLLVAVAVMAIVFWSMKNSLASKTAPGFQSQPRPPESEPVKSGGPVDALILGSPDDPLIQILPPALIEAEIVPIQVTPGLKSALEPLIQRAPAMFEIGRQMADQGYRVVFSPAVTRALRNNTMELLPSGGDLLPVARSLTKGKKFVEIGKLAKSGGIRFAGAAAMSWQVLSIATAQHYLNDINARLAGIEDGIKSIQAWLEEEKKGQLRSDARYLREIANAISRAEMHPDEIRALYGQLDDVERNACSIGEMARELARRRIGDLEKIDISDWFDRHGSSKRMDEWLHQTKEILGLIKLAQTIRIMGCQVKALLPGDHGRLKERLSNIQGEIEEAARIFDSYEDMFFQKIQGLGKREGNLLALGGGFDDDYRQGLKARFSKARKEICEAVKEFDSNASEALKMKSSLDSLADKGMELEIRQTPDGEIEVFTTTPHSEFSETRNV